MDVCLFFYIRGEFCVHGCTLDEAESYGDFLIYPGSHFDIWEECYIKKFGVDFDYFPRGRVAYNKIKDTYVILYDECIEKQIQSFVDKHYKKRKVSLGLDEHYKCSKCNENYAV